MENVVIATYCPFIPSVWLSVAVGLLTRSVSKRIDTTFLNHVRRYQLDFRSFFLSFFSDRSDVSTYNITRYLLTFLHRARLLLL